MRLLPAIAASILVFASHAARAEIVVRVDKSAQRLSVSVDGVPSHTFVVSTGLAGGPPNGSYKPQRLERTWHSRLFNMAPMPYSIFFHGHYAIHGTNQIKRLGRRASKGCVRLHPKDAAVLFNLVKKHGMAKTRIIVEPSSRRVEPPAEKPAATAAVPGAAPKVE
ncbi:MAG: L,D-transpeptidase [Pseudorhodoplanes sp.]|uniref:L,D-transpeptidase n=1 Tax=Pseudorhodoplanes sp. TaxID=1934341 RepID=UPI003D123B34